MGDDRYPVNPLDGPAAMAEEIRALWAAIHEMQGAPLVGANVRSVQGATDRAVLGKLDPTGAHYGVRVPSADGTYDAFYVDERGMDTPQFSVPANWVPGGLAPYVQIAAAAGYNIVARFILNGVVTHPALRAVMGWSFSDTTTAGNFRVLTRQWPSTFFVTTVGPTRGPAANGTSYLNLLHGIPLGTDPSTFYAVDVEARVTSGAGGIQCYEPALTLMNDAHGATAPGAWT